jgi:hypothetical protein
MHNDRMDQDGHVVTLSVFLFPSSTEVADRGNVGASRRNPPNQLLGDLTGWAGVSLDHGVKIMGLFVVRLDLHRAL